MAFEKIQNGSLRIRRRLRGPAVWEFRYRVTDIYGRRRLKSVILGNMADYPNEASLQAKVRQLQLTANPSRVSTSNVLVSELIDRFVRDEKLLEIKAGRADGALLHYSTACAYLTILN